MPARDFALCQCRNRALNPERVLTRSTSNLGEALYASHAERVTRKCAISFEFTVCCLLPELIRGHFLVTERLIV
jgi:hypothetical protein